MQSRQLNRRQYFHELATTSEKYFIPYIQLYQQVKKGMKVLEIGCGDGGNLLPFSHAGCDVVGVDMSERRIKDAKQFFQESEAKGYFIASDVFLLQELKHQFNLIICHDVIEHIDNKEDFMQKCKQLLIPGGGFLCPFLLGRCLSEGISKYVEVAFSRIFPSFIYFQPHCIRVYSECSKKTKSVSGNC